MIDDLRANHLREAPEPAISTKVVISFIVFLPTEGREKHTAAGGFEVARPSAARINLCQAPGAVVAGLLRRTPAQLKS